MRMLLPDVKLRRRIRELPSTLYNDCQYPDFNEALRLFAEFYKVPVPAVEWYEYLDDRKTLGLTWYEGVNGKLGLSHPENWRKMKASPGKPFRPTCACWVGPSSTSSTTSSTSSRKRPRPIGTPASS